MRKLRCLLFVLMRSYTFCYITCITVPLTNFMPLVFFYLMFSEVSGGIERNQWHELGLKEKVVILHKRFSIEDNFDILYQLFSSWH